MNDGGVRDVCAWTEAVGGVPLRTPARSHVNTDVLT
jgi:hypothetical protein